MTTVRWSGLLEKRWTEPAPTQYANAQKEFMNTLNPDVRTPQRSFVGYCLSLAALLFIVAWWLMPDAATNDAEHILRVVSQNRTEVLISVIVQIVSSIAFIPTLLGLTLLVKPTKTYLIGATLLLVGAMGMCADAFFHLIAYEMTADGIVPAHVQMALTLIQTEGILLLIPLMLPFFAGSAILSVVLKKQGFISGIPGRIFAAAMPTVGIGSIIVNQLGTGRHFLALAFLSLFALGLIRMGFEISGFRKNAASKSSQTRIAG